jgi:spermidine/putrescine transport system ATP-binding protein
MYSVELKNICKSFGKVKAVDNFSLDIFDGEFLSLLGPSGCGKSTLLRIISGLENADNGAIYIDGSDMTRVPAHKRPVNMVFQSYSLFPHMNVFDNIAFGPRIAGIYESTVKAEVSRMLELVGLEGFENRTSEQLSGGQKQRIAVARALINKPRVLLLDEPLGALDLQIRKQMQLELRKIHKETQSTFIYVTHDQEEALVMSDRIVIMTNGRICQIGSPREIYNNPENSFSAGFIGETNLLNVRVAKADKENLIMEIGKERITAIPGEQKYAPGDSLLISIRPEYIDIYDTADTRKHDNELIAVVETAIFLGPDIKYEALVQGVIKINIRKGYIEGDFIFSPGDTVKLGWNKKGIVLVRG